MEKIIYINVDDYNMDSISTIKGNNNAEVYKIYLQADNEKIDLTGKTVNLAFLKNGSTEGDIIKNLNVTDPKNGEITLKITNKITKQNGTYSCQLAISGKDDFLEHTATFSLTVENNIFSDISNIIADSKDLTYIEAILDKASKISETLKDNTSNASNINTALGSNITEANNINSKLLENTSTATSLNKNLESNIDLAKEVKETIKDLDTKNIEATEKIETLTGLNSKAIELSNNIQQGLPLNSELIKNTESAKTANNELIATNNDAKAKKTDLDNSLEEAKKYINGLDGSQNIPQIRMDVDALQNGLKSNQALAYKGSSISAGNTLEGRTEGMRIKGRTLVNLGITKTQFKALNPNTNNGTNLDIFGVECCNMLKPNTKYTIYITGSNKIIQGYITGLGMVWTNINTLATFTTTNEYNSKAVRNVMFRCTDTLTREEINNISIMILEEEHTAIPCYFEGIKSFGEQEGNKISILSSGANLINPSKCVDGFIYQSDIDKNKKTSPCFELNLVKGTTYFFTEEVYGCYLDNSRKFIENAGFVGNKLVSKYTGIAVFRPHMPYSQENSNYKNLQEFINKFMVNEGQNLLPYEPYKCDKKDILIKKPLKEGDYIYEDNGQVKVFRGAKQYTITGNENWIKALDNEEEFKTIHFQINLDDSYDFILNKAEDLLSNNFPSVGSLWSKDVEGIYKYSNNNLTISILKTKLTTPTVEGLKAWLKANPTDIIYNLATPNTEVIENCVDIDLDTFGEKTYFNILNSLPGTLDFKVPSNIASIVQANSKAINEIYNLIDTLVLPNILQNTTDIEMLKLEKLK